MLATKAPSLRLGRDRSACQVMAYKDEYEVAACITTWLVKQRSPVPHRASLGVEIRSDGLVQLGRYVNTLNKA